MQSCRNHEPLLNILPIENQSQTIFFFQILCFAKYINFIWAEYDALILSLGLIVDLFSRCPLNGKEVNSGYEIMN